jgi:hypothetical protein
MTNDVEQVNFFVVLGIKPRVFCMPGKYLLLSYIPQPAIFKLNFYFFFFPEMGSRYVV